MFEDDNKFFFADDEFALQVVVVETQQIVTGIFDRPYTDDLDISGFNPSFTMQSDDVETFIQINYRLEIDNAIYRVRAIEPDGTGITRLALEPQ